MRWFYYYPTWTKPTGGNKQIRLAAALLTELGVETYLLRDRRYFAPGGFDDSAYYGVPVPHPTFAFEDAREHLGPEDVLVLPEVLLEASLAVCQGWKCRIAVNNQNGFYALRYSPRRSVARRAIEFAISNAPYVSAICRDYLGIPPERIFEIPYWVARTPFEIADPEDARNIAVCYMPRKLPEAVNQVKALVRMTHPEVPWVEIDDLPEEEVAHRFRANSIFMSTQYLEGFGLPALEAMACGCLVAGFKGTSSFAHPYAGPANGLWVGDGDVPAAAAAVRRAVEVVRSAGPTYAAYLEAGLKTARRFTRETALPALAAMIKTVRERRYDLRRHTVSGLGWKGKLCAYRLLYNYDRLGWPGRLLSTVSRTTKPFRQTLSGSRPWASSSS